MLAMLWERYPDHPNLLPAYWDESSLAEAMESNELSKHNWVSKPRFGREGTAITYWKSPETYKTTAAVDQSAPTDDHYTEKASLRKWAADAEQQIRNKEIESFSSDEGSAIFPLGLPVFQQW